MRTIIEPSWVPREFAKATMPNKTTTETEKMKLDAHVVEMMHWHFSPETGTPYWLNKVKEFNFDPRKDIKTFEDMIRLFPTFDEGILKYDSVDHLIPKAYKDEPYIVCLTGGTTSGAPSRRPTWNDYKVDYQEIGETFDEKHFPLGARWLNAGPSGPRRLPWAIDFLSKLRGGSSQSIDFDPVGFKVMLNKGQKGGADAYMGHLVNQVVRNLDTKAFSALFISPPLLAEVLQERKLSECGIKGVFVGGTEITSEYMRIVMEMEEEVGFYPTYGNTLMGLAKHTPILLPDCDVCYYAPQPRAVLRIVDPKDTSKPVQYGQWGRVELTTLTREFLMIKHLERDEALRREPHEMYAWDGVQGVRPLGTGDGKKTTTGAY